MRKRIFRASPPPARHRNNFGFAEKGGLAMVGPMPSLTAATTAYAAARPVEGALIVEVGGRWRITGDRPVWSELVASHPAVPVRIVPVDLAGWDSALVLFVAEAQRWAAENNVPCDASALPDGVRELLEQLQDSRAGPAPAPVSVNFLATVGLAATSVWRRGRQLASFVGECVISVVRLLRQPSKFRWRDCLYEMQQSGAMSLPIVGLIAFLVGVTLAYTGAIILRQFGGDIWVADLVGLSMTREMGAVMTGIVLAGRTGAAFAAEIGNMKANEELDALETLGIRPVDFLVIPRIVALVLMMPLLVLYANALGIIGGMVIALFLLNIPPTAYWVEMLTIVDMSDLSTGLIKAVTFGAIVALSGCLRGLQADRSAVGVGRAATSAVVTAILLIIVADALFAVVFNILGW